MTDSLHAVRPWLTFIGCVLVGVVLYLAQAVLVPLALAVLLAFLLTPVVTWFQRRIGRVPAVLLVVIVAVGALGAGGWIVTQQLASLAYELPAYRQNIRQKIQDVRGAGTGGSVEVLQKTVEDIEKEIEKQAPGITPERPIIVRPEQVSGIWSFPAFVGPLVGPLTTAGLVIALVIFILLERDELRSRLIRLFGHGKLAVTTKAFDEAGRRVSRYLLVQSFVNLIHALGVAVGLFLLGVPYAILWAALAGMLRFIPYVGPVVAFVAPVVVALAVFEGWMRPLAVFGLFVGLELFTNLVLETVLYAGAIGVSQVALLIAVAFWSWLWGPLGLLLATPLTVCLAVLGKYVPGFEFVSTLISDEPVLTPDLTYYQRLVAGDQADAAELLEKHIAAEPVDTIFDAVMLPALNYAERDRLEGRLESDEELAVIEATAELLNDMLDGSPDGAEGDLPVLGLAADGAPDVLALRMLSRLLRGTPFALEIRERPALSSEIIAAVQQGHYRAICIADLPPSAPSRSRVMTRRLRTLAPDVPILIGRWAPASLADDSSDALRKAGATHVAASLLDTRTELERLVPSAATEPASTPEDAARPPTDPERPPKDAERPPKDQARPTAA